MKTKRKSRRTFGAIEKLPSERFRASYMHGSLGSKRRYYAPTTFTSESLANAWLSREDVSIQTGTWQSPTRRVATEQKLADYGRNWVRHQGLRHNVQVGYSSRLERYVYPTFGERTIGSITSAEIRKWHKQKVGNVAPSSLSEAYKAFSSMLSTAVQDGVIDRNPCNLTKVHSSRTQRPSRAISATAVREVAAAMPAGYEAAVLIAGWCGLRWGEVIGLRRSDLDQAIQALLVFEAIVVQRKMAAPSASAAAPRTGVKHSPANFERSDVKTAGSRRPVYIPPHILPQLVEHLESHVAPEPEALLFTSVRDTRRPLSGSTFHRWFKNALAIAKVEDMRFHELRHTAATLAQNTGDASGYEIMARIGHTSPRTAARYQHVMVDRQRALAVSLSALALHEDPGLTPQSSPN